MTDQTKFRLNETTKIENYFNSEINQRKSRIKKLSKYVTTFDYVDKVLIVSSATSGRVCIISFTNVVGAPVGIGSASFTLSFSLAIGIKFKDNKFKDFKQKLSEKQPKII